MAAKKKSAKKHSKKSAKKSKARKPKAKKNHTGNLCRVPANTAKAIFHVSDAQFAGLQKKLKRNKFFTHVKDVGAFGKDDRVLVVRTTPEDD